MKPIRFKVTIDEPNTHLVKIEMTVRGVEDETSIDLCLPVWTPGSYLVREYAQFARVIRAVDGDGARKDVQKVDKSRWRVEAGSARELVVTYEVYAHTLNVRYSHVEADHAFLHGPSLFLYPQGRLGDEIELSLELPADWAVHSGLEQPEVSATYRVAHDFDQLFDCPILAGSNLDVIEFEAANIPHRFVMWGRGNYPSERLALDTKRVVEASARIFGGTVPYESFSFLTLLTDDDYGGLEHRNSTALMVPRHSFVDRGLADGAVDDKYIDALGLVSHEHFHAWNVKRIHPERLGPFDYQAENYTRDLWTVEGITSYYTYVSMLRAQVIEPDKFLEIFAKQLKALHEVPGRLVCSLRDASFDTWIKLYRPHPHNRNANVSYYLKGCLASLVLDVAIRVDSGGEKSLDDVMRHLWTQYSKEIGYPEGGFEAIVEEAVGLDVSEFFDIFIRGTDDPDWNDWFENIGLEALAEVEAGTPPTFGFDHASGTVKTVWSGSPAERAGLQPGDDIVAIDRFRAGDLKSVLLEATPGSPAEFHVFRRGELISLTITPDAPSPSKWILRQREDADDASLALLNAWLGRTAEAS